MILSLKFREQMSGFLAVVQNEFDNVVSTVRAWSNVEHNDNGSHAPNVGNTLQFLAGANIGAGQPVYVSAGADQTAAGQAFLADASAASKSTLAAVVGLATGSVSAGANVVTRDRGIFSGLVGLTAGKVYYVGTTAGSLTFTQPTNAVLIGLATSTTDLLLLLRNPTQIATQALLTWTGPTSGSQNMASGTVLTFTTAGTYTITVVTPMTVTIDAVGGGGGGGGDTTGSTAGNGGGGGGGVSRGTSVSLASGKVYTLIIGAGGAGQSTTGTAGGASSFVNTTNAVTHVAVGGGGGGIPTGGAGGAGGTATTGSGLVVGGAGGAGAGASAAGNAGLVNANGAGGGGSGAGQANHLGPGGGTGGGSSGTTPAGASGGSSGDGIASNAVAGGTATGGATGGGVQASIEGGGGGGGGASAVIGSVNGGGGGGGAGACGSGTPTLTGGNGDAGVAMITFVSAP